MVREYISWTRARERDCAKIYLNIPLVFHMEMRVYYTSGLDNPVSKKSMGINKRSYMLAIKIARHSGV